MIFTKEDITEEEEKEESFHYESSLSIHHRYEESLDGSPEKIDDDV